MSESIRIAAIRTFATCLLTSVLAATAAADSPQKPTASGLITPTSATFVENRGQFNPKVHYQVNVGGQTAWLTSAGIVIDTTRPSQAAAINPTSEQAQSSKGVHALHSVSARAKGEARSLERLVFSEGFQGGTCSKIDAKGLLPGVYNYFQGRDPAEWRTNVRRFSEVVCRDVWPGIDLRIYGNGSDLEQEFVVRPGGDLSRVQITYRGIEGLSVADDGSLEVATAFGKLRETKPRLYQQTPNTKISVNGGYRLTSDRSYMFEVETYDPLYPLVVDPTLLYSTFLGGSAGNVANTYNHEFATGIAVDTAGNAYVAGYTYSKDFPTTTGAFQTTAGGGGCQLQTAFITKLNPTGAALVYSTYLGCFSWVSAIAVDSKGDAYVTGQTGSSFPTTPSAYYPTSSSNQCNTADFFVTEFNPTGDQLLYSTCLDQGGGGTYSRPPTGIAVDSRGGAFITGAGYVPTTSNAYQQSYPGGFGGAAFVMAFDTTASGTASLPYSTYFGVLGNGYYGAGGSAIAVDSFGAVYIAGEAGGGLPTTPGAYQPLLSAGPICPGEGASGVCPNAFIAKFNLSASGSQSLVYSTYLGGPGLSYATGIAVDNSGNAYIAGQTQSGSFPVTPGAFQTNPGFNLGVDSVSFVTKLNAGGSRLIYSSYFEGICANANSCSPFGIAANGIALDTLGDVYVAGNVHTPLLPVTPDAYQSGYSKSTDYSSAFLTKFDPTGSTLIYSSYLGGSNDDMATAVAVDQAGDAYVVGHTASLDFPVTGFAFQAAMNGPGDAFVAKFPLGTSQSLSVTAIEPTTGGNSGTVSPQIFGTGFHAGATAQLNCGGQSIAGTNVSVGPGGRLLNTTFDLTRASSGQCSVMVTNPDGTSATLSGALIVQPGGVGNVQISLTGVVARQAAPEVSVAPNKAALFLTATNTGLVDAPDILVVSASADQLVLSAVQPSGLADITTLSAGGPAGWLIPNLAPGQSIGLSSFGSFPSTLPPYSPVSGGPVLVFAPGGLLPPFPLPMPPPPVTGPTTVSKFKECIEDEVSKISIKDAAACAAAVAACAGAKLACSPPGYTSKAACYYQIVGCAAAAIGCAPLRKCLPAGIVAILAWIVPNDPNSLVGSPGVGGQQWMAGAQGLSYIVSFNNEPAATAPAQQVVVTQPLGQNVSLATLILPGVAIPNGSSNVQVAIPPGSFNPAAGINEFVTNVDLRPNQNLLVSVDAKLNPSTQTLTWTLTSIDPATGAPPLNPLIGFLPPGAGANVSFSFTPTPGLATGTQVVEQATVVFDGQAPMSTAAWTNTIDNTPPVSHISSLPSQESPNAFTVGWSGTDLGSGIATYTIYVSDNGGPFTILQNAAVTTSDSFTGQVGHTYGFYSIATDAVGNVEAAKSVAEATTTVIPFSACDINQAGVTNVVDVQALLNEALGEALPVHDLNADAVVNVVDVQIVTNAALKLGCTVK